MADEKAGAALQGTVIGWGAGAPVPRPTDVVSLAAGARSCLVVRGDGTVSPWGANLHGPMSVPSGLTDVSAVAVGQKHALALRSDGTIVAWGDDPKDSTTTTYMGLLDVPPDLDGNVAAIAAGVTHSLALTRDGTVTAWGWDRGAINAVGPTQVPYGLENVVAIAAGGDFSLALQADGAVVAWGGLSGLVPETTWHVDGRAPTTVNVHHAPTVGPPATLGGVVAIAAGRSHALALRSNGTVYAWGDNSLGECNVPHDLYDVVAIAAGGGEASALSLALKSNGTVVAWGADGQGNAVVVPEGLAGVVAIDASALNAYALLSDGTVVSFYPTRTGNDQASPPPNLAGVAAIAAANNHSVALKVDGTVTAWGDNENGQTDVPAGLRDVVAISTAGFGGFNPCGFCVALKRDGTVVAWGSDSNKNPIYVPPGLHDITSVTANAAMLNGYIITALRTDGSAVAWNAEGLVRLPADARRLTAVEAAGWLHTIGRKGDGSIMCWDRHGNVCDDIPEGLSNVVGVAGGAHGHVLALLKDGTVVGWGGSNRLGEADPPADLTGVAAVATGDMHSLALRSDGTVVAWGWNLAGQVEVPAGLRNACAIAGGYEHSLALIAVDPSVR